MAVLATVLPGGVPNAAADNVGDIRQGRQIAVQECSRCHQVEGQPAGDSHQAPSFAAIASMNSATHLAIRVFLRTAHRNKTMPNIILSEDEVDALASYILSLRK